MDLVITQEHLCQLKVEVVKRIKNSNVVIWFTEESLVYLPRK
mgnify:CR=1 FL=1